MPIDEFVPDLSTLQSDYQILTELRSSANTRTYLARHLKLNRDVTISVIRLADGDDPATLTLFAADARTLTVMRHRNVVPVIEGRWVTDGVFAIVRARVRGSTLDQLVRSAGPMPAPRVAGTLQQVHSAIEWARDNGIVHRHVAADAIVFQQGSGRVLIELDPSSLAGGGVPDACADARTIGRLSYEMLSGHRAGDAAAPALSDARPELSSEVVRETEALMQCNRDATSRDARVLIALLGGKPESAAGTPLKPRDSAPVVPVAPVGHAAVVVEQRFGFNARLITAVAVAAIIAVMGILLLHRRSSPEKRSAGSGSSTDTSFSTGDVALPPTKPDTHVVNPTPPSRSAPPTMPMAPPPSRPRMVPPETRRHEPPRGMPPSTLPKPIPPASPAPRDSLASRDVCDSADVDDQRVCLTNAIERNDAWLSVVYQRLIAAIRRQADVQEGDPDPAAVTDLRAAQQRWTDARIATCRDVGEGALYARARGQCFADQSAKRTRELEEMLAAMP